MKKLLFGFFTGAALAYFLDPEHAGKRISGARSQVSGATGAASKVTGKVPVLGKKLGPFKHDNANPDNVTLKDRVETEILRDPKFGRAPINFNVEDQGVVVIHGELPNSEDINELIDRVKAISDVRRVESYLHLPNTPAPNKLSAIDAS